MKKILFSIICFFSFNCFVLAAGYEEPVVFTLVQNFYSEVTKVYEDETIVFYYKNKLLNMDLTDNELKTILSQKSGSGSARLAYYETLNIKVNPINKTPFESLKNKTKYYRANGGGTWSNNLTNNQTMEETASLKNLTDAFWPWGFNIQHRTTPDGTFSSNIPSGKDLNNKTLEQQLATVLDLDLTTNPDSVIDAYSSLWRFNPLVSNIFLLRFDFLDQDNNKEPTLKQGATDEYLTSSLKKLGTYNIAIKYSREEHESPTSLEVINKKEKNNFIPIIIITIVLGGMTILLMKNKPYRIKFLK